MLIDEQCKVDFRFIQVRLSVYVSYLKALGFRSFLLLVSLFGIFETTTVAASYWLTRWTSDEQLHNLTALPGDSDDRINLNIYYLLVYGGIAVIQGEKILIQLVKNLILSQFVPKYSCIYDSCIMVKQAFYILG